jgi:predicted RNA polymerase sigma factor
VTDWRHIVALYDRLLRIHPSPVVQLNRAVAIAMCDGPEAGLSHIDALLEHGELANYYLAHSARADMYRRLGRTSEARSSYEKALALTQQEPERQFLPRADSAAGIKGEASVADADIESMSGTRADLADARLNQKEKFSLRAFHDYL